MRGVQIHVLKIHLLQIHLLQIHVLQIQLLQIHVLQIHLLQIQSMFYKSNPIQSTQYFTICPFSSQKSVALETRNGYQYLIYGKQTKSSLRKAEVVYTTSKKLVNMDSLEDEFRSLTVSQSKGDELPTSGPPDCNTSGSLSPLDLFIRDLDERKGKFIPCCQEVTDIQNSVENVLKALLRVVEKELPFYKTILINSGSYYEGTKVGKPDEFDYFIQLQ